MLTDLVVRSGRSDIPLTPNGEIQVASSAKKLVGTGKIIDPPRIAHLFISPRSRARRTYELLFSGAAKDELKGEVEISEDIREWEYGAYEGLLTAQIRAGRRERGLDAERPWNIWLDGCEGGETAAEVSTRLDRIIAKIRAIQGPYMHGEKGVDIVLIAHGHILRAFAKRWINFQLGTSLPMMLEPGAVGVLSELRIELLHFFSLLRHVSYSSNFTSRRGLFPSLIHLLLPLLLYYLRNSLQMPEDRITNPTTF
jgi:broad specificity phosphatase PhoE